MKRTKSLIIPTLILAGILIGVVFILQSRPRRKCAPTPAPPTLDIISTRTPTPNPNQPGTPPPPEPSVTPLPLSKTTDLDPELANEDKMYVWVMRCEGTFELFLVRPVQNFKQLIPLNPGDVILDYAPPRSLFREPPPIPSHTQTASPPLTRGGCSH